MAAGAAVAEAVARQCGSRGAAEAAQLCHQDFGTTLVLHPLG